MTQMRSAGKKFLSLVPQEWGSLTILAISDEYLPTNNTYKAN